MNLFETGNVEKANLSGPDDKLDNPPALNTENNEELLRKFLLLLEKLYENLTDTKPQKKTWEQFLKEATPDELIKTENDTSKLQLNDKLDNPPYQNIAKQSNDLVVENETNDEENLSKFLNDNPKLEELLVNVSVTLQNNEELRNLLLLLEKQYKNPKENKPQKKTLDSFLKEANPNEQVKTAKRNTSKFQLNDELDNPFYQTIVKQSNGLVGGNEKNDEENLPKLLKDNPKFEEILSNPTIALQNNEKLRKIFLERQKQMGWNLLPTDDEAFCDVASTDLGLIELNEKIKIHQSGEITDIINIMMFGNSGCGQTTLLSYLIENNQLIGTDTMSTQQFSAETFQLPSDKGMNKIRINESPGMCSGFEIQKLQEHWNHLISRVNKEGGVSVFLLLIKSNVRITSQFIDEIEEFSELYFDEREELWKRTVVVFTSIDELKGCNSLEDRVNKLETQIAKPGMERVKKLLDQTSTNCIYVNCKNKLGKKSLLNDLQERIHSIHPTLRQTFEQEIPNKELRETLIEKEIPNQNVAHEKPLELYQDHGVCKNMQNHENIHQKPNSTKQIDAPSDCISKPKHPVMVPTSEKCMELKSSNTDENLVGDGTPIIERKLQHSESFCSEETNRLDLKKVLQHLSTDQILTLCVETCKDKYCENVFIENYKQKFSDTRQDKLSKNQANPKAKKKKKKK